VKGHITSHFENKPRPARIEGQVRAVSRMIDEGEYGINIITQIQAARSALQSVSRNILEKHLKHCVADALENGNEADITKKTAEIMRITKRMGK
jgi:DNA-binding FrmR family transcriptional regulator